jgi:hypothetical protein
MSEKSEEKREKKVVGRTVAIALGIICIALAATLIGAIAYYMPMINDKNNTISSLDAQISQLHSNVTSLQKQIASLNSTIMSDPSAWVNMTVTVEGYLSGPYIVPPFENSPWDFQLISGNYTIGVSLSASVNTSASFWIQVFNSSAHIRIYGVVEKGEITYLGSVLPGTVTYYIEAETLEPL